MPVTVPYDPIFDAIVAYLGDGTGPTDWDFSLAPLVYENDTDGPPSGDVSAWVLVVLNSDLYGQQSIGAGVDQAGNRWDESGTLWFHVFTPRGTKSREARRIAKGLANMFRGQLLMSDALEFGDASLGASDPGVEKGNYYLMSVSIDWHVRDAQ